jgi:hypothetical protein
LAGVAIGTLYISMQRNFFHDLLLSLLTEQQAQQPMNSRETRPTLRWYQVRGYCQRFSWCEVEVPEVSIYPKKTMLDCGYANADIQNWAVISMSPIQK